MTSLPRPFAIRRLLRHVSQVSCAQSDELLSAWALSNTHLSALLALAASHRGALNVSELCAAMNDDIASVSRACNGIVARRLVGRERGKYDRRTVHLTLTPDGRQMIEEVLPPFAHLAIRQYQVLDDNELRVLETLLEKLSTHLSSLDP